MRADQRDAAAPLQLLEAPQVRVERAGLGLVWRALQLETTRVALVILGWKLVTFVVIGLAYLFMPFDTYQRENNFYYPFDAEVTFATAFTTWDSSHYLYLAEHGYRPYQLSNSFSPLYPVTIEGLGNVIGDNLIAGLLISNAASAVALYIFYIFVKEQFGSRIASRSLLLFIAFPTAFFLNIIYTEALFLLLMMAFLWLLYRKSFALASLAAFPLALTRLNGLIIVVPLAVFLVCHVLKQRRAGSPRPARDWIFESAQKSLYLLPPIAGFLTYLVFMQATTGDASSGWETQSVFTSDRALKHLFEPMHFLKTLVGMPLAVHDDVNSITDRVVFLCFLASLPLLYRRVDKTLFALCLLLGLQPLLGSFMSYLRYILLAFPLYIAYASWLTKRSELPFRRAIMLMFPLQMSLLAAHVSHYWIA